MLMIRGFNDLQKALEKAHLMAAGFSYEELKRPLIAVINSWAEWQGHIHLRSIAEAVKIGIRSAGGTPLEFNTIALCDRLTGYRDGMRYSLPSRDLIADSIEVLVRGQPIFDGLVLIASCDKIVPGMLMAAARLNLPTVFMPGGISLPLVKAEEASKKGWARKSFLIGQISERELLSILSKFYSTPGACGELGTACTMQIIAEALGMAPAGSAIIPARSSEQLRLAKRAGELVMELVKRNIRARDIMTRKSFENAIMVTQAIGGSLNTVLHLPAIADEAGYKISYEDFDRLGEKVPMICSVVPNGPYTVFDLYLAGGTQAILKRIEPYLNLDVLTVEGRSLKEILQKVRVKDSDVIRSLKNPLRKTGGIAVLRGNLAEIGGVIKSSAVPENMFRFTGPARVYNKGIEFFKAVKKREIREGEVVVVRYEGMKGGPGMPELPGDYFNYIAKNNALITDGRFSGTHYGLLVGYIMPEAIDGGNIAIVEDGDEIIIDIKSKRLDLMISNKELRRRREKLKIPRPRVGGFLRKWSQHL